MPRHVQIPAGIQRGQTIVYDPDTDSMVAADLGGTVNPQGLISDTGDLLVDDVDGDVLFPDGEEELWFTSTLLVSDTGELVLSDTGTDWLYGG